ncbi:MAG: diguanylate cyclase (GGDEF)-like protein [Candidatus Poriferisodalaceae bacterium]|jgi:diguanylate cyclase (GGDEF)-like protein
MRDELTGLLNRRQLDVEIAGPSSPEALPIAVLFVHLDGFKEMNDHFGHHAGDQLLAASAARIEACSRPTDRVFRIGGDKFVILLLAVKSAQKALTVADRIVVQLRIRHQIDGQDLRVGASVGVTWSDQPGDDGWPLVRDADAALYVAKRAGKGQFALSPSNA